MGREIATVADLEACVGEMPAPMQLKVIDHLDAGALKWIAASPFAILGCGRAPNIGITSDIGITLGGGAPGFVQASRVEMRLAVETIDAPELAVPGMGFGSLFLLPGIRETLRVNGHIAEMGNGEVVVKVKECYGHCGKALIRSGFWDAAPTDASADGLGDFAAASRFMALATVDTEGRADVSPKGDPAGRMAHVRNGELCFADRPGNRRVDSFRNILAQPHVAALLAIPGSTTVMRLSGKARLTTDEAARSAFVVQDKTPKLVTAVRDLSVELYESPALVRARLWPVLAPTTGIEPSKLFVDHVKLNKGLAAKVLGSVMSVPGLAQKSLERDYKKRLY